MTHSIDEEHAYLHPGYKKPYPIETVLRDLAAQEGCDGEPYDAMVFAADTITALRAALAAIQPAEPVSKAGSYQPTLEDALQVPEVRAVVEAARKLEDNLGVNGVDVGSLRVVLYRVLAALEPAPRVNETPKSEHDRADVLIATPAAVAKALEDEGEA